MRLHAGASMALLVALAACEEESAVRPQWTITLRTDAPLPVVADRVLVEIVRPDGTLACDACRRLLDASDQAAWPISFGLAELAAPLRIRVRLHRAGIVALDGTPDPSTTIDALAALPETPAPVTVSLRMKCFGVPSTDTASCDPSAGVPVAIAMAEQGAGDASVVPGSWSESTSAPCTGAPPEGMVCIPGGLFFFADIETGAVRDQLVRVSSFFVDRDEMTVGQGRTLLAAGGFPEAPGRYVAGKSDASVCAYRGQNSTVADDLALNCVTRDLAAALCTAQGKRLLTEAEFAYAAGNGARRSRYPWGDDDDVCAHAVVARGAVLGELVSTPFAFECRSQGATTLPFGPVAGGSDADVTSAGLRNLAGNLAEWVEDSYASLDDDCWKARPLLVDPTCRKAGKAVLRGGAWSFDAWSASARFRLEAASDGTSTDGVRCARSAR